MRARGSPEFFRLTPRGTPGYLGGTPECEAYMGKRLIPWVAAVLLVFVVAVFVGIALQ